MHRPKALWTDARVASRVSFKKGMVLCYSPCLFMPCVLVLGKLELPNWSKIMNNNLDGMISFPHYLTPKTVLAMTA